MAESESGQEKTESPTARRLQQAREEGKVARSAELSAAAVLLAGAASIGLAGGESLATFAQRVLRDSAASLSGGALTPLGATQVLRTVTLGLIQALMPFVAGVAGVTILVNVIQSRGALTPGAIKPKFAALNPTNGFKKLLSMDAVVNLLKSIVKLAALGTVTWLVLRQNWPELISLAEAGPAAVMAVTRSLGLRLVTLTGLAFLVVALADYAWQLYSFEKSLRMTKQEVMLEHKEMEGDPQIKGRIRSLQRQRARQRMLQAVPNADVVITNPTHVAVALEYDPARASAPIVVAMGERKLAERIKEIARASGVPLVENKPIARALLATCIVSKPIPPALYTAVAEILAFVFRLRNPRFVREARARAAA